MNNEQQVTRWMEPRENKDGYWYYVIGEGEKTVIESDLYQTSTECVCAGMAMMEKLHEQLPLLCNSRPTWSTSRENG